MATRGAEAWEARQMAGMAAVLALLVLFAAGGGAPAPTSSQPQAAAPQPPPLPVYECRRAGGLVLVDGQTDEPAWGQAEWVRGLCRSDGRGRGRSQTDFRAVWDDANLYLSFVCVDSEIVAKHTERDAFVYEDDCVEAFLSSGNDLRRYFEFEVNPLNAVMDASVFPNPEGTDKVVDYSWNCDGIEVAVRKADLLPHAGGKQCTWTVEMAMPFSQIGRDRRAPKPGEQWRANFYRCEYAGEEEYLAWSPPLLESFHTPERFGYLVFTDQPPSGGTAP